MLALFPCYQKVVQVSLGHRGKGAGNKKLTVLMFHSTPPRKINLLDPTKEQNIRKSRLSTTVSLVLEALICLFVH